MRDAFQWSLEQSGYLWVLNTCVTSCWRLFLFLPYFCCVERRYAVSSVLQGTENTGGVEHEEEVIDQKFSCETRGLLYLNLEQCLTEGLKKSFEHFHDFTLNCGAPIGTMSMSPVQWEIISRGKWTCCGILPPILW